MRVNSNALLELRLASICKANLRSPIKFPLEELTRNVALIINYRVGASIVIDTPLFEIRMFTFLRKMTATSITTNAPPPNR